MVHTELAVALDACAEVLRAIADSLRAEQMVEVVTETPDRLLTAAQAAALLNVTDRWLYRHARRLPFAHHLSPRVLRFSEAGLRKWAESR